MNCNGSEVKWKYLPVPDLHNAFFKDMLCLRVTWLKEKKDGPDMSDIGAIFLMAIS